MTLSRNVLMRLDPEMVDQLQAIADVEGRMRSDVIREALASLIEDRRSDPSFQRQLKRTARTQADVLRALRSDGAR